MKERLAIKVVEIHTWARLLDNLDALEQRDRRKMEGYYRELNEKYPDALDEEARQDDMLNVDIQEIKVRFRAYENIRAVIRNAVG